VKTASKKMMEVGQAWFTFPAPVWSRKVYHLLRFRRSGKFNGSVSYQEWLEFYTPLSGGIGGAA